MAAPNSRRYRIVALLNKGASGRIYRAVLEDDGQETDIAIKILRDEDIAAVSLTRLREEARLIGMVEDRALVKIERPIYLDNRWALVMDLITGVSLQRLTSLGAIPPSVVVEIVGEVARVLDKVWHAPGPNGKPLQILHRDIKPSNLQVNSAGKLRVLDFGIAKVDFRARDPASSFAAGARSMGLASLPPQGRTIPGFISPERLEGEDTPAGDVFSLGATAQALMGASADDRAGQLMMALSTAMVSLDPADRPTASEVEAQCAQIRRRAEGPTLREWSERNVSRAIAVRYSDELVGKVLTESEPPSKTRAKSSPQNDPPASTPNPSRSSKAPSPDRAESGSIPKLPPKKPKVEAPSSDRLATSSAPKLPPKRPSVDDDDDTMVLPSEDYLDALDDSDSEATRVEPLQSYLSKGETPRPADAGRNKLPPQKTTEPLPPRVVQRNKPERTPSLPPAFDPSPAGRQGADRAPAKPAPRKSFPKKGKSDDDETVVLPADSYLSMLDEPQTKAPPQVSQRESPEVKPARSRLMLGVAALLASALSIALVLSVVGTMSAFWAWPWGESHSARKREREPTVEIVALDSAMASVDATRNNRLTFSSIPLGVDIYLDRKFIGQTPVVGVLVPEGAHEVIFVSDSERLTRKIEVGKKKPTRYVWKGGELWEEHL